MAQWRAANIRAAKWTKGDKPIDGQDKTDDARLVKAQADEREAKAALALLELEIKRGEYVPTKEMEEREDMWADFYRKWGLSLENDLASRVAGLNEKECRVVIRKVIRDHLTRMSKL